MKKHSKRALQDPYSLEGDGIIENFFHILWGKDPIFGTIPSVYVPHTVVLRFNQPIAWYFMKDGTLKKKTRKNLNLEHIKEVFMRNKNPSGIVAVFMRYKKVDSINHSDVVFEYFNETEFLEFMNNHRQVNNGVLQQFIQPKGDKNYIITANWSPQLCFFEKTESRTRINDQKYDIYDRVLTIEAENFHSKEGPVRGYVLPNKIQRICANIAQHIQNVSFDKIMIARMILQFKIDENNRIWFLACSSLRLDNGSQEKTVSRLNLRTEQVQMKYQPEDYLSKIKVPGNIKTNIIKGKPINMHKTFTCINCDSRLDPNSVFEGTYKTIIEGYEWDHLKSIQHHNANLIAKPKYHNVEEILERLQGQSLDYDEDSPSSIVAVLVPPLIRKIHPYLNDEIYTAFRHHAGFLTKTMILCQECLLHIQTSQDAGLKAQKETAKDFFGTGQLQPERLKVRYQHTVNNLRQKGPSQTMISFPKFYFSPKAKVVEDSGLKSDRTKRNSDLPQLYSEIQGTKDFITMNTDDEVNLSIDSNGEFKEVPAKAEKVKKVMIPINEGRPATVSIKIHPKENRVKSVKSIHLNPGANSHRLITTSTPKQRGLIDQLSKKENSLGSTSGFLSTRSDRTKTKNSFNPAKNLQEPVANEYVSSNLMNTLHAYMPKKKFLINKYKSLKSISGATTERTAHTDAVERILQNEGNLSARNLYYNMEDRKYGEYRLKG